MFWNDENDSKGEFAIPDDVVDVAFKIGCPTIPLDHAHSLSSALLQRLPWLQDEVHTIFVERDPYLFGYLDIVPASVFFFSIVRFNNKTAGPALTCLIKRIQSLIERFVNC